MQKRGILMPEEMWQKFCIFNLYHYLQDMAKFITLTRDDDSKTPVYVNEDMTYTLLGTKRKPAQRSFLARKKIASMWLF